MRQYTLLGVERVSAPKSCSRASLRRNAPSTPVNNAGKVFVPELPAGVSGFPLEVAQVQRRSRRTTSLPTSPRGHDFSSCSSENQQGPAVYAFAEGGRPRQNPGSRQGAPECTDRYNCTFYTQKHNWRESVLLLSRALTMARQSDHRRPLHPYPYHPARHPSFSSPSLSVRP